MHQGVVRITWGIAVLIVIMWLYKRVGQMPEGTMDPPPSERCRWQNPAGYGMEPETEEYNGLFY